ncbi:MAG TPA: hypothetical protein VGG56_09655 [Terracidiphilus sp.]
MLLKLDQGSLHFDIHVGGEPFADLIGSKGAGLDEFVPPGLEGHFQISTKLATHLPPPFIGSLHGCVVRMALPPDTLRRKSEPSLAEFFKLASILLWNRRAHKMFRLASGLSGFCGLERNFLEGNRGCVNGYPS